ncbi:Uncharacterised protein [Anaerobiospirillum thomasii]|uniref:hypothetical protein n=1 Tax=Anaerobiospirillum thomasii TaxID=179995 RepID=UPI000D81CA75|nr:hypothetical protein [Anaerobiospirillum thomasii]SPT71487.1 Uncharacterised protein [Anaerobiospirillum thomasii]
MLTKDHSFEPRIGTAQLVFGIIYVLISATALTLALYVQSEGGDPKIQYFMLTLFLVLAAKSFFIYFGIKKMLKYGTRVTARLVSCEGVRGITIMKAVYDVEGYGPIEIQTRLAGETASHEIKRYLKDRPQLVPALIVDAKGKHPRGMILVRTIGGHLDEKTIKIED